VVSALKVFGCPNHSAPDIAFTRKNPEMTVVRTSVLISGLVFGVLMRVSAADELSELRQRLETLEAAQRYYTTPANHWVKAGKHPASFILPGTSTTFKVGGYVKLDAIFDFQDAGDRFSFDPNSIPVGTGNGQQFTAHARQTRINLDTNTPTEFGDLHTFVETDFFGDGNRLRLRHAYGELGDFLAGQTWVLAVDADAIPETLDFNGPDGNLLARRAQLRWTIEPIEKITWSTSLHDPRNLIETTVLGEERQRIPVLSSSIRCRHDSGHVYYYAGVGANRFVPDMGPNLETAVWGAGISVRQQIGDDWLIAQFGITEGLVDFLPPMLINERDIPIASELDPLLAHGWVLAYQHAWSDTLRSNAAYRSTIVDNSTLQPDEAIHRNQYVAANLIWSPFENRRVDIGVEYLWGFRENKDGGTAIANRLQFSAIFRLP
jgi:hypothetical protein